MSIFERRCRCIGVRSNGEVGRVLSERVIGIAQRNRAIEPIALDKAAERVVPLTLILRRRS